MLFREILCGAEKGKIRELQSATFPLDLRHLNSFYRHSSIDQNPIT